MKNLFANQRLVLAPGQAVSGVASRARLLTVVEGRVWVTLEGSPDDHWLTAGESIEVGAGGLVVIESDADASCIALAQTARRAGFGCRKPIARAIPLHNC